mgnify:CR=1 FL=1
MSCGSCLSCSCSGRNSLVFSLPEFIDDVVVVGTHAGLQGIDHGVGALAGRPGVGLILPQRAAHYSRQKAVAYIDLVSVSIELETINPLLCFHRVYELVGPVHKVQYGVGVAQPLALSGPTGIARPLTASL